MNFNQASSGTSLQPAHEKTTSEVDKIMTPMPRTRTTNPNSMNEQLVQTELFFHCINQQNLKQLRGILANDFVLVERGTRNEIKSIMALDETMASLQATLDAVPDLCMKHGSIEKSSNCSNTVVVHDYTATGSHNGAPLDLFDLPMIEPSGAKFALDKCEIHFVFDPDTKISRIEEIELQEYAGLSGIYNVLRHSDSMG